MTVPEMWISACVGIGSLENAGATILTAAQPTVRRERTALTYGPTTNVEGRYTRVREQISAVS